MSNLLRFRWRPAERRGYYTHLIIPQLNLTVDQAMLAGPALVPRLLCALTDPSQSIRGAAAEALGYLGDARAVEPLILLLRSPVEEVRETAAHALGLLGQPQAVGSLIEAVQDPSPDVRRIAIDSLRKLRDPRAIPALIDRLAERTRTEHGSPRQAAFTALRVWGQPAVPALVEALQRPSARMRVAALRLLAAQPGCDPAAFLIPALQDPSALVRRTAAQLLCRRKTRAAVEPLLSLHEDCSTHVRRAAVTTLLRLGGHDTRELRTALEAGNVLAAEVASRQGDRAGAAALLALLQSPRPVARWEAARMLGRLRERRAVEPLVKLLQDEDARVRAVAGRALERIGDPYAAPALVAGFAHLPGTWRQSMVPTAYRALCSLGPQAVPAAIDGLRHPDRQVRRTAAELLGDLGERDAFEALREALQDGDWEVRKAAVKAFRKLGDPRAVELLVAALRDENWSVAAHASTALAVLGDEGVLAPMRALVRGHSVLGAWVGKEIEELQARLARERQKGSRGQNTH